MYELTPYLNGNFFDSLRNGYPEQFDKWFKAKAREGREAWVSWEQQDVLGGICIYTRQINETITEKGLKLNGAALKLSTFKVAESARGKKIGELLLKTAFRYATANRLENIFIHGASDQHHFLFEMLEDFGFSHVGSDPGSNGRDAVYLKPHPVSPPADKLPAFEYLRRYFPHFRQDATVSAFIVPIKPEYHRILFPDYPSRIDSLNLFEQPNTAGNAIKLAYLCNAQIKQLSPGDIVLFYRSEDEKAITSLGIVEEFQLLSDPDTIARLVRRRTVYSMKSIEQMAKQNGRPLRVMLFRLVQHFNNPVSHKWLQENQVANGNIQSIRSISNDALHRFIDYARG